MNGYNTFTRDTGMARKKGTSEIRKFGLELIGVVPWGTHLCQFYQSKQDLIDILVPYFRAGLENNEFCMWVTANPLNTEDAKKAMEKSVPNFSKYLKSGQIEIISYKDWYVKGGSFDCDRVLQGWTSKLETALKNGFDGLRLTGNTFWLEKADWNAFTDYEEAVNTVIGKYRMIAVCTYSLDKCNASEIIDVVKNHQFALIKRSGKWELIESTGQKRITDDLRRTEQKFADLYNSMTEGVVLHDLVYDDSGKAIDYVITAVNPSFERITGLSKEQSVGKRASELYGTGSPPYIDIYAEVASSGKPTHFETYFPPMKKHFGISVVSPSKGTFNTIFHDVTDRKQAEQALQQAKRDWERTFDSVPDLIAVLDKKHRIVRANKAMAQKLGVTPEQCIGLNCYTCVHGTESPPDNCPHAKTVKDGLEHIAEVHEDRLGGDFLVSTTPLKDEQGLIIGSVHVARDITDRKKIEVALRESQKDLNRAQAVAKTGSWRLDTRQNVLFWSDETYSMFGIPKGTLLTYQTFLKMVHPEDRAYVDAKWNAAIRGEPYDIEHRIIANGEIKWVREKAELEFGKDKIFLGGFGTVQDITERKRAEQELFDALAASHQRQAEVSALLEASKAVLTHHEFSKAAKSIFTSCKDLLGATAGYVALLSNDEKENQVLFLDSGGLPCSVDASLPMPIRGFRAKAYSTGKAVYCNDFSNSEWASLMPKGHVMLKNVLFAPLRIDNKTVGIMGLANKSSDFTDRDAQMATVFGEIASVALINSRMLEKLEENEKKLKEHSEHLEEMVEEKTKMLRDAERLAAIGATAGMVGHDIRNPLQSIIGELFLAKGELESLPESDVKRSLAETVATIEDQVSYINKIVTDLQDFAKPLSPCREEVNMASIVQSVISTINIPQNIKFTYCLEANFPNITADSAYMKRILTNLLSNAIQAMPQGGKLDLQARQQNSSIIITVADTGVGIPESAKAKLFQPLFTTKSKGQGFGLAVCKRLVDAMNGTITFESEEGKGTTFIVKLPIAK